MKVQNNPELDLAYRFVNETNRHIFLTGKAGTGKTTFLKNLRKTTKKRNVVVAPTGVAAINAGGMTIHSLFQLPFGLIIPGQVRKTSDSRKMRRTKINLLRSLDLLIIDEISMVRADILDAIDHVMRRYRRSDVAFGGVQLLMIGDLHQLPPVVKHSEQRELYEHFSTAYFFGSNALKESNMIIVELKHVYRQSDQHFINILNEIRDNKLTAQSLDSLNARYDDDKSDQERGIILTSHRNTSAKINNEKLLEQKGASWVYKASIDGIFTESAFPNDVELVLKAGAKVMFVKNDPSEAKLYYNGKIGQITDLDNESITVLCDDGTEVEVFQSVWENTTTVLNERTKILEEEVIGSFTQFPLRLAWAITIHKSQGLTFDKVVIDAQDAFAHGQVYVALSRCRSLEGITLISKISESAIKTDRAISSFEDESDDKTPTEDRLNEAIKEYEAYLLMDLFDFGMLKIHHQTLINTIAQGMNSIQGDSAEECHEAGEYLLLKGIQVAEKFRFQLHKALTENVSITQDKVMMARLKKSGQYFYEKLKEELYPKYKAIQFVSDNSGLEEKLDRQIEDLQKELYIKGKTFQSLISGFDTQKLISAKANAEIDYNRGTKNKSYSNKDEKPKKSYSELLREVKHKELYEQLYAWREYTAKEYEAPPAMIATIKGMIELSNVMPRSVQTLKSVQDMGKKRIERHGETILGIIEKYCSKYELSGDYMEYASKGTKRERKKPTEISPRKKESVDMYLNGMTIPQIAEERSVTEGTIQGHLAEGIRFGLIDILKVINNDKLEKAIEYFKEAENRHLTPAKDSLGDEFSYGELRMVVGFLEKEEDANSDDEN